MANPADEAAVQAARANEAASRTYAKGIMATATENYQMFQETAEQALAQRYIMYAKSGNVSTEVGAIPETAGTPVGSPESADYLKAKTDIQKKIDEMEKEKKKLNPHHAGSGYEDVQKSIDELTADLAALGEGGANLPEIRQNAAIGHLSGSDLLTEVGYRDLAQRHGYTMFRTAENQAAAAVEQAGSFNRQADYLKDAATWNAWSTALGVGLTILGGILSVTGMPELGLPLVASGVSQATR